jgi:hypothetical protein
MAVNCFLTLNSTTLAARLTLPISYEYVLVRNQKRALNGQLMTAHRATKIKATLTFAGLTEAQRSSVLSAAATTTSVTLVDEAGTSYTVVVQAITKDLVRTEPAVEESTSTTGPGYYDMSVDVEEI